MNKIIMTLKVIGFDLFGTLVTACADENLCVRSICSHLNSCGVEFSFDTFITHYRNVLLEHRKTRYEFLREVNNCVWVADTLKRLEMNIEASSPIIVSAVEKYFSSWQLTLAPDAPLVLKKLGERFTIALVSNFTDSAFLHRSLKKLGIMRFFDHIIVSETFGWRKPHSRIFEHFLKVSKAKPAEAVFIGDDVHSDIYGAKGVGIRSVLLANPKHILHRENITRLPDLIVNSLSDFEKQLINVDVTNSFSLCANSITE